MEIDLNKLKEIQNNVQNNWFDVNLHTETNTILNYYITHMNYYKTFQSNLNEIYREKNKPLEARCNDSFR